MFPNIDEQVYELFLEMENCKYMMFLSRCPKEKEFYRQSLANKVDAVSNFLNVQDRLYRDYLNSYGRMETDKLYNSARQRQFSAAELAQYDGSGGKPAYVAVNGIVYDVSTQAAWGGGSHFGLISGKDLTQAFEGCHGEQEILGKLSVVGTLVD